MTEEVAVAVAKAAAQREGWRWRGPVEARSRRAWLFFGPQRWHVRSNVGRPGGTVRVVIDAATGVVIKAVFVPR